MVRIGDHQYIMNNKKYYYKNQFFLTTDILSFILNSHIYTNLVIIKVLANSLQHLPYKINKKSHSLNN
jgi:hypothetical protein